MVVAPQTTNIQTAAAGDAEHCSGDLVESTLFYLMSCNGNLNTLQTDNPTCRYLLQLAGAVGTLQSQLDELNGTGEQRGSFADTLLFYR